MSVIVRMEMPLNCAVCRCHTDGWCYLLSIQPSECTYDSRPSWCPIVGELPEQHGNLIDGDIAKARIHKNILIIMKTHQVDITLPKMPRKYCPNCGSRMPKGEQE